MSSELINLSWEQFGNEVVIKATANDVEISFPLEEKLINYLASNTPKTYHLYIDFDGHEKVYYLNLEGIKALVSMDNSLKISIGKSIKRKTVPEGIQKKGRYCVARGESYHDRFLSEKGWQHQRTYFDVYEYSELKNISKTTKKEPEKTTKKEPEKTTKKEPEKIETKIEAIQQKDVKQTEKQSEIKQGTTQKSSSKLKECVKCKEIIPISLDTCPYCKTNQNDKKEDDDVDISLV